MLKTNNIVADKLLLSNSEWHKVHNYLKVGKNGLFKSKSEKKIPKFSVISKLNEPEKKETEAKKEFNTLEKQIKEWECLEHMKMTNSKMFGRFVNRKKRQGDIDMWLFEQGVKDSLTKEKINQMKKMLHPNNQYSFHPNITQSSRNIVKKIRFEDNEKLKNKKKKIRNKTFKEKTNANMIFGIKKKKEMIENEELEDSWDFPMQMNMNTKNLKSDILNPRKTLISNDFLNLISTDRFGKSINKFVKKKKNQFALSNNVFMNNYNKKKVKSKSVPRKTMYLKGKRKRQLDNRLLNLIGQSRFKDTISRRSQKDIKMKPLPVPHRGTIIQKESPIIR